MSGPRVVRVTTRDPTQVCSASGHGPGLRPRRAERVCDRFQTMPVGKGTGSAFISSRDHHEHGGTVTAEKRDGVCALRLRFPISIGRRAASHGEGSPRYLRPLLAVMAPRTVLGRLFPDTKYAELKATKVMNTGRAPRPG